MPLSSIELQLVASLSRRRHGFDSRTGHQSSPVDTAIQSSLLVRYLARNSLATKLAESDAESLVVSTTSRFFGIPGSPKAPEACNSRKFIAEHNFPNLWREGCSIRLSSSSVEQLSSTKRISLPADSITSRVFSTKSPRTVRSNAKVKIKPFRLAATACLKTSSQTISLNSTNGKLPKSKTDSTKSTAR